MNEKYTKSPIIEAICEFRFANTENWDATIPGLLYHEIKGAFPKKEKRLIQEWVIDPNFADPRNSQHQIKTTEQSIFKSENSQNSILVSPSSLAISKLKPYDGWENFREDIDKVYTTFSQIYEFKQIDRIGLRYINIFDIPSEDEYEKYFHIKSSITHITTNKVLSSSNEFILSIDDTTNCKIQLRRTVPDDESQIKFILDIDCYLIKPLIINRTDEHLPLSWIENAHKEIISIFDKSITDITKENIR